MNKLQNLGVKAEYHKLTDAIVCSPGLETYIANLHFRHWLNCDVVDVRAARKEHRLFRNALENEGVNVWNVRDVLESADIDTLRDWASSSLYYTHVTAYNSPISPKPPLACTEGDVLAREKFKSTLTKKDAVTTIMMQPCVRLWPGDQMNSESIPEAGFDIVKDIIFQRDSQIVTDKGLVQGRMKTRQRDNEVQIMKWVYQIMGIDPIYAVVPEGAGGFLEGGDYIPVGKFALIGCGLRTDEKGVEQLLKNPEGKTLFGFDEIAVMNYRRQNMDVMHLDTYLNVVAEDKVLVLDYVLKNNEVSVDIWKRNEIQLDASDPTNIFATYKRAETGQNLEEYLKSKNLDIVTLTAEEQRNYGINALTLDNAKIICVLDDKTEQSYLPKLSKHGIEHIGLRIPNLRNMYGAFHCMSNALHRVDPSIKQEGL